ncbi:MAG: OmpA family protein [Bacteroidetes bacterium]|nr:OmpA family protein [Bacteroidota bacterium]
MTQAKAFFAALVCSAYCFVAFSQDTQTRVEKPIFVKDSLTSFGQSDIFIFPNVNKVPYYHNPAKIKQMKTLAEGSEEMYAALKEYVKNFGVENFAKNIPMIWKLADLSLKFGPKGEAILLYKLAIKHHRQGIDISRVYKRYDSAEQDKKEYYVPLEKYYELVNYRKEVDTLHPPHSVLESMGENINSLKEDYGPAIGNVDYVLLFTSKRNPHKKRTYNEDIFFSTKIDGAWTKAEEFKTINSEFNEGSACLSPDGKSLFFSRCVPPITRRKKNIFNVFRKKETYTLRSYGNCDLYMATLKKDSTWGDLKNLGAGVNSAGWESQPAINHTGDTLYFASNRLGSFGLSDIYFSVKDKRGFWGRAQNAGPIINTVKSEVSPFYHHKFNVLYFSSDGHPLNFGDFDIYKSYKVRTNWAEPLNIGPLVNGAGSEYYFTIDSKSQDLYYARSSEDDIKNLDLYSFPLPMEAHPEAIVNFSGIVLDQDGKPKLKGIVSIIDLDRGVQVAPKFLREDGTYDFKLINKRNYLLVIQGDDFFRIEQIFYMDGNMKSSVTTEPIESKIAFQSVEFENGKSDILPGMHNDLAKVGNFLLDHPDEKLNISGHTDSDGDENFNLQLSQSRAEAIRVYLIEKFKIAEDRITARGYGSSKPIVHDATEEAKRLNRRVEFELIKD